MCGTVTNPARHSASHPGEIRKLTARRAAHPIAVRRLGNAPNSARPIVGFVTRRNPNAGRSAAPVSSGDHWAVCTAINAGSDTSATLAGDSRRSFVIAHANRPKPRATNRRSAHRIDADANGVIVNTAVIGYISGNVVSNARPGPTDAYGSLPWTSARAPAQTGARSDVNDRGVLKKIQAKRAAVTAAAAENARRAGVPGRMLRRCSARSAKGLQMTASATAANGWATRHQRQYACRREIRGDRS